MANTRLLKDLTALEVKPDSPRIEKTENGTRVTRTYNVNYADAETAISGLSFGDADADFSEAKLRHINYQKDGPQNATLELVYIPPTWPSDPNVPALPAVGTVTQGADANPIEIPIEQVDGITSQDVDENGVGVGEFAGITHKLEPQPVYRRGEVLGSFTFSEANIIENVGKIDQTPAGMTSPTSGKWLKTGRGIQQVGDDFDKQESWQYASEGWNTTLYASVS